MKTVLEEMYDDIIHKREQSLRHYLDLERIQTKLFALELGVSPEKVDEHYNKKYDDSTRFETKTIRTNVSE